MKVVMKTTYSGPKGQARPDEIIDLPTEEAEQLCSGGYAVKYVEPKKEEEKAEVIEEAVVEKKETTSKRSSAKSESVPAKPKSK